MPNYDTYKIYFTKNLSKNQEKIKKKVGKFQTSHLHSFLINRKVSNSKKSNIQNRISNHFHLIHKLLFQIIFFIAATNFDRSRQTIT